MTKAVSQNYTQHPAKSENSTVKTMLGVAGGTATGAALFKGTGYLSKIYLKKCVENLDKFTPEEKELLSKEAGRMVEESGIKNKGFNGIIEILQPGEKQIIKPEIEKITTEKHPYRLIDFLTEKFNPKTIKKPGGKISTQAAVFELNNGAMNAAIKGSLSNKLTFGLFLITAPFRKATDLLLGKWKKRSLQKSIINGCYESLSNRVFSGKQGSLLHEVGHAINKNQSFLSKIPRRLFMLTSFVVFPFVFLNAMFSKKPEKTGSQDDNRSTMQKFKDFTHKHMGLTALGCTAPLLAEEGMASSRANKFLSASKTVAESTKKQHVKALKIAYGSYLLGATALAVASKLVVSVKDKIVEYQSKKSTN